MQWFASAEGVSPIAMVHPAPPGGIVTLIIKIVTAVVITSHDQVPHVNITFHRLADENFKPDSELYLESLGIIGWDTILSIIGWGQQLSKLLSFSHHGSKVGACSLADLHTDRFADLPAHKVHLRDCPTFYRRSKDSIMMMMMVGGLPANFVIFQTSRWPAEHDQY